MRVPSQPVRGREPEHSLQEAYSRVFGGGAIRLEPGTPGCLCILARCLDCFARDVVNI